VRYTVAVAYYERRTRAAPREQSPAPVTTSVDVSRVRPASHSLAAISTAVIQRMTLAEGQLIAWWVANGANDYLSDVPATRVDDAPMSAAVRFRWFNMNLKGTAYMVGLNIHYGGDLGALWVKNLATDETMEFHPHANPTHGLPADLITKIKNNHEGLAAPALLNKI